MTKLTPDETCESCGGLLVPPQIVPHAKVPAETDYVCLQCSRPYRWAGNPPRLGTSEVGVIAQQPVTTPQTPHRPFRLPPPAEELFRFVRARDRAPMSCDLRFRGKLRGWEVQFLERGECMFGRAGFVTRESAVEWAESERRAMAQRA